VAGLLALIDVGECPRRRSCQAAKADSRQH
jgi:hypothetical protein